MKYGGHAKGEDMARSSPARCVDGADRHQPGGGARRQTQIGEISSVVASSRSPGLRITTSATIEIVEMVPRRLDGKHLVGFINEAGGKAVP